MGGPSVPAGPCPFDTTACQRNYPPRPTTAPSNHTAFLCMDRPATVSDAADVSTLSLKQVLDSGEAGPYSGMICPGIDSGVNVPGKKPASTTMAAITSVPQSDCHDRIERYLQRQGHLFVHRQRAATRPALQTTLFALLALQFPLMRTRMSRRASRPQPPGRACVNDRDQNYEHPERCTGNEQHRPVLEILRGTVGLTAFRPRCFR